MNDETPVTPPAEQPPEPVQPVAPPPQFSPPPLQPQYPPVQPPQPPQPQYPPAYPQQYQPYPPPQYPSQQPYPPQYPPAYPPQPRYAPPPRVESPRAVAVGVMNLFFSLIYLVLLLVLITGNNLLNVFGGGDGNWQGILGMVGIGLGFLGLFIGGIQLLNGSASGKLMTLLALISVAVAIGINLVVTLVQVAEYAGRYFGEVFGQIVLPLLAVVILLVGYPLIAWLVINRPNEELHLK